MYALDNKSGIEQMPEIPEVFSKNPLWFTEGRDGNAPSYPGAHWFNIVQAELLNVLKEAGIEPEKADLTQLAQAFRVMAGQVDSIAALREFEPVRDRQMVYVKGYYANSTKGGGYFVADLADTASKDNGGTVIVTNGGKRWLRIAKQILTLEDFGAVGDGVTDDGASINAAFLTCAYHLDLYANKAVYITNQELKMPSGLRFFGAGIDSTVIKAGANLPAMANLMTNISNNYAIRTSKDRDIDVRNMTLDADWRGRYKIGDAINNQACGMKLSAVEACYFYKVKAVNAALHCFDVCADQYVDTGNISDTSTNPSDLVVFDMCEAWNPYRDDAFTVHNSGGVVFNHCRAYFDGSLSSLGNTQQGFEADEGSYNVTFNDCVATGFACGYQSKGHATTMPAKNISFNRCEADNCGYGFMASVGTNPTGKAGYKGQSVSFTDCAVQNSNPTLNKIALYIYGADGVKVDGFTINADAKVTITQGAGRVDISNLIFNEVLSSNLGVGCIHIESTVTAGVITLRNISTTVAQSLPLIAKTNNATRLHMDNISLFGKGDNGIYLNRNPRDTFINSRNQGYVNTIFLSALNIGLSGDVLLDAYNQYMIFANGAGDANKQIKAPVGTKMYYHLNGKVWTQTSTDLDNPKWLEDLRMEDGKVKLSGLTVGLDGSTSRNLAVNGSAVVSGGLSVGKVDTISLASAGYAQAQSPSVSDKSKKLINSEWFHSQFTQSINRNGWQKLPSGLILQWGGFNANNGTTFDFPIAFNEVLHVYCTDENVGGNSVASITVTNKTNTSFSVKSNDNTGLFSMWAVGK